MLNFQKASDHDKPVDFSTKHLQSQPSKF